MFKVKRTICILLSRTIYTFVDNVVNQPTGINATR